jgi:predicted phosphodiesterase
MKRIIVISDTHCGHKFGLTPPEWWAAEETEDDRLQKHRSFQRAMWEAFASEIDKLRPCHVLVCNGDMIEGKGEKTGGIELITSDRHEQVRMAKRIIEFIGAPKVRITYGTRYHVGGGEDFESLLRDSLNHDMDVRVSGHLFLNVEGVVFDVKHRVGRSSVPYGQYTPAARAAIWNDLWAATGRQPYADVVVRSHVHYFCYTGSASKLAVITPALQYNSIYGIRECENIVHLGFVVFDVEERKVAAWWPVLFHIPSLAVHAESL